MQIGLSEMDDKLRAALLDGAYKRYGNPFIDFVSKGGDMVLSYDIDAGRKEGNKIGVPKVKDSYDWKLFKSCLDLCFTEPRKKVRPSEDILGAIKREGVFCFKSIDGGMSVSANSVTYCDVDSEWVEVNFKKLAQSKKITKVCLDCKSEILVTKKIIGNYRKAGMWFDVHLAAHCLHNKRKLDLESLTLEFIPTLIEQPEVCRICALFYILKSKVSDYYFVNYMSTMFFLEELISEGIAVDLDLLDKIEAKSSKYIEELETEILKLGSEIVRDRNAAKIEEIKKGVMTPRKRKEIDDLLAFEIDVKTKDGLFDLLKFVFPEIKNLTDDELISYPHSLTSRVLSIKKIKDIKKLCQSQIRSSLSFEGRIHSEYSQTTSIGRLSSSRPNVQGIPKRNTIGCMMYGDLLNDIGKLFISDTDRQFKADFNQLELRVLAGLSADKEMIKDYNSDIDLHEVTAARSLGISIEELQKSDKRGYYRDTSKGTNYGQIFGQSAAGLVMYLKKTFGVDISEARAKEMQDSFVENYPGVKKYQDGVVKSHKSKGYGTSYFGRVRYTGFSRTIALHTPIVTTAADLMMLWLRLCQLAGVKIQQTIHDSAVGSDRIGMDGLIVKQIGENLNTEFYYGKKLGVKFKVDLE